MERIKLNLWKDKAISENQLANMMQPGADNEAPKEYHIIPCEEKFVTLLTEKIAKMHKLVTLSSEILLLSTKQKYMPAAQAQNTVRMTHLQNSDHSSPDYLVKKGMKLHHADASELTSNDNYSQSIVQNDHQQLIEENNNLKRTIFKYENTLAQLDSIFRRDDDKEECIYELKKLTESQLHDVIRLQNEVSDLQKRMALVDGHVQLEQENQVLKQEIAMLREQ